MSKHKLSGKALVIQITGEEIRIARMSLGSAAMQLQEHVVIPTPEGTVEDGELLGLDALRDVMAPVVKQGQFRHCRNVVFVLCSTQVISESVTVPAVKKRQRLGQMLEANMDMYFPVNPAEYRLTWQAAEREKTEDAEQQKVQLWAVPQTMLSRYYVLANSMGLTVSAVDFCGNSLASAVNAGFAPPAARRGKAAEQETDTGACLYINAEADFLLLTFVQNGQVKLQRLLQRGYSPQDDLNEVGMALDYFLGMPGQTGLTKAVLSGGRANEDGLREGLAELLNISVRMPSGEAGPEWLLCQGASRTELDFGNPELNRRTGAMSINKAWQYGLVLLGGAALTASVMLLLTSKLTWDTELSGLRNLKNQLTVLAQQNAGNAENYNTYSNLYDKYSADWNKVFNSVRTYNDNLELVLGELETKLPKDATVTALSTTDRGLAVQVAFQDKEDAAYFLVSLRDEPYMTIQAVSNLTIGPVDTYAPDQMISVLYAEDEDSPVPETNATETGKTADDGSAEGTEAPPTEGSYSLDGLFNSVSNGNATIDGKTLKSLIPLLQMAGVDSGTIQQLESYADLMERMGVTISLEDLGLFSGLSGLLPDSSGSSTGSGTSSGSSTSGGSSSSGSSSSSSGSKTSSGSSSGSSGTSGSTAAEDARVAELRLRLQYLTSDQLDALQRTYGPTQATSYDLKEQIRDASVTQRKNALRSLLESDPAAMYKFFLLLREDVEREEDDQVLCGLIWDDIHEDPDMRRMFFVSDQAMLDKYLPKLLDTLTKNTKNLTASEQLIQEDNVLSEKLAIHLAAKRGKIKEANTALDLVTLRNEIDSGAAFNRDAATVDAVKALTQLDGDTTVNTDDGGTGLSDNDLLLWLLMNQLMNQNNGNSGTGIPDIFSTGETQTPADNRYYLTLVFSYDEALIQAEQVRKGLDRDAMVEKVEVDQ